MNVIATEIKFLSPDTVNVGFAYDHFYWKTQATYYAELTFETDPMWTIENHKPIAAQCLKDVLGV